MKANQATGLNIFKYLDITTIILYLTLVLIGILAISGASYHFNFENIYSWGSRPVMQVIWFALALVLSGSILLINQSLLERLTPILYLITLFVLMATIVLAPNIKGSHSWLVIGPIRLQPAEFAKITSSLMLAWTCNQYGFKVQGLKNYSKLIAIVLTPVLLILLQNETGSALVFFALFIALFREGFSGAFMGIGFISALYFILTMILSGSQCFYATTSLDSFVLYNLILVLTLILYAYISKSKDSLKLVKYSLIGIVILQILAYFLSVHFFLFDLAYIPLGGLVIVSLFLILKSIQKYVAKYLFILLFTIGSVGFIYSVNYVFHNILEPHQQVRIKLVLGIVEDPRGKGYNVEQAKMAIGSGGLLGKGFLEGTQTNLAYVPEQDTDFILCTIGEEFGFIGASLLLLIYMVFILRLAVLAERQTNRLARVYGYCIASIFFFHVFINVGMVLGLLPVIGIPLPFLSYGGSSLWGFSIMLFIFLSFDAQRERYP